MTSDEYYFQFEMKKQKTVTGKCLNYFVTLADDNEQFKAKELLVAQQKGNHIFATGVHKRRFLNNKQCVSKVKFAKSI